MILKSRPDESDSWALWRALLAQRPSLEPGHDPRCRGIDEWLQRVDRRRTCRTCWEWLLELWQDERALRPGMARKASS